MATQRFKAGERPAVRITDPAWAKLPKEQRENWQLEAINSVTAYVRHAFYVGALGFDAENIELMDPEPFLFPIDSLPWGHQQAGSRTATRDPDSVYAPRTIDQLREAGLA